MNYLKLQDNAVSFLGPAHYCSGRLRTHHRSASSAPVSHCHSIFSASSTAAFSSCPHKLKATGHFTAESITRVKWLRSQSYHSSTWIFNFAKLRSSAVGALNRLSHPWMHLEYLIINIYIYIYSYINLASQSGLYFVMLCSAIEFPITALKMLE